MLSEIKTEFEKSFDVDNLIDYIIFSDITENWDGFNSNWQWVTYNGEKWYCCLYDTNNTFGNMVNSPDLREPLKSGHCNTRNMMRFIVEFYSTELNKRYKELRDKKIIDAEHIVGMFVDFMSVFSDKIFEKEYKKWESFYIYDSIPRLHKWVEEEITNMDIVYNYKNN